MVCDIASPFVRFVPESPCKYNIFGIHVSSMPPIMVRLRPTLNSPKKPFVGKKLRGKRRAPYLSAAYFPRSFNLLYIPWGCFPFRREMLPSRLYSSTSIVRYRPGIDLFIELTLVYVISRDFSVYSIVLALLAY